MAKTTSAKEYRKKKSDELLADLKKLREELQKIRFTKSSGTAVSKLSKIKEETNKSSKRKESLEKDHANFIHNYYLLKKEIKFRAIKKSFETKLEDQITQQRKKKKHKTLKNTSKLMVSDSLEEKSKTKAKDIEDKTIIDNEEEKLNKEKSKLKMVKLMSKDLKFKDLSHLIDSEEKDF